MKTNNNSIVITTGHHDPVIENIIRQADAELQQLAVKHGKHFAKTNQPELVGDKLEHYTGEFRTRSEMLGAKIFHLLQPAKHIPHGKMDIDFTEEKAKGLDKEVEALENQNHNELYDMEDFNPKNFFSVLFWAGLLTFIILIGEILFNTKAFQVAGENMLFALIISFSISITVAISAHLASFLYKKAENTFQRRVIIATTLFIVTVVFIALAFLRSIYLESKDVHISPFYFVIINLFFFIVSALLSYFILPTWQEIKEGLHKWAKHKAILKRQKQIASLKNEREKIKEILLEKTKNRLRILYYAKYGREVIRKMHTHAVEVFKNTNMLYRSDRKTPDCFSDKLTEPDIEDVTMLLNPKNKPQ